MVEFRDTRDRLVGACLTDWLSDGLSAVYSFFSGGFGAITGRPAFFSTSLNSARSFVKTASPCFNSWSGKNNSFYNTFL